MKNFIILPSQDPANMRLLRIPNDYQGAEAFRHITGLIAEVEGRCPEYTWEDIAEHLENQGYEVMNFIIGPSMD